jgi:hypothetical protein
VPKRAIIILFYQVPNGAIQWIFKCQMGRLLLFQWTLSAKWGDYYYMPNGAILYYMPNGAIKTVMPIGAISGSLSICISCICIDVLSLVFVLIIFLSDEYFKLKRNDFSTIP